MKAYALTPVLWRWSSRSSLIPLILILMGVIDFGRAYTQQLSLSAAAREGVRVMAVQNDPALGQASRSREFATRRRRCLHRSADSQIVDLRRCVPGNAPGQSVTVTLTYPLASMTGMFDSLFAGEHLTGKAVMRCGG